MLQRIFPIRKFDVTILLLLARTNKRVGKIVSRRFLQFLIRSRHRTGKIVCCFLIISLFVSSRTCIKTHFWRRRNFFEPLFKTLKRGFVVSLLILLDSRRRLRIRSRYQGHSDPTANLSSMKALEKTKTTAWFPACAGTSAQQNRKHQQNQRDACWNLIPLNRLSGAHFSGQSCLERSNSFFNNRVCCPRTERFIKTSCRLGNLF